MNDGVNRFFGSINGAASFKDSELVDLFVYYLTVEAGAAAATVTQIGESFEICDLTPPTRLAPYLSEGLKSTPQKFIKANGGYKLQRHYRDLVAGRLGIDSSERAFESAREANGDDLTPDESKLLKVIEQLVPSAGISYRQALSDLRDDKRMSFRGPALELREVLREVLDHTAPDKDVMASPGFQLENNRSGPTMKQKVRYILKKRGDGKTKASSPEDSASAVDAKIGDLTRSAYDLGSLATHVASERRQVVQVKWYIEAVLHDILRID
jgi:Predicted pPIWI-associating nuclease